MNQRVHSCMRGCFTLNSSGLWKTVTASPDLISVEGAFSSATAGAPFSATAAIVKVGVEGRIRKTEGFGFSGKAEIHTKERATKSPEIKSAAIFCSRQCEVTVEVRMVKRGSFEVRATKNCLACLGSSVKAISDFTSTSTCAFTYLYCPILFLIAFHVKLIVDSICYFHLVSINSYGDKR